MKNTQPKGSHRWAISNIIGDKKLFKLEDAGYKVVPREDLRKKQNKLRELTEINTLLSNLISQMADLLIVAHPSEFDSDKPFESLLEILEKIIPQEETK